MKRRGFVAGISGVLAAGSMLSEEAKPALRIFLNHGAPEKSRANRLGSDASFPVGFGRDGFRKEGQSFVGGSSLLGKFRVNAILTKKSFSMEEALIRQSGRSRAWLSEHLFANMNSIDFDGDGKGGEYGAAFIGLEPLDTTSKQPFHFGEYKGVFRWYSYAIHGTQDEERIGKRITGGCINVGEQDLEKLVQELEIGSEVEVVDARRSSISD